MESDYYSPNEVTDEQMSQYANEDYEGSTEESCDYDAQVEMQTEKEKEMEPTAIVKSEDIQDSVLQIEKKKDLYLITRGLAVISLKFGEHYGPPWPGSDKSSLWLAGAELVNALMIVRASEPKLLDSKFDLDKGFFYFNYQVDLYDKDTGRLEATGIGSCNSWEDAYRYRTAQRKCPNCGQETILKSKYADKTPEKAWYCWAKKGGCGAQFELHDPEIVDQQIGKVETENPANQIHNIQQKAYKRAHVKATRLHGCLSNTFSQDGEDFNRAVEMKNITPTKSDEPATITESVPNRLSDEVDEISKQSAAKFIEDASPPKSEPLELVPLRVKVRELAAQLSAQTNRSVAKIYRWAFDCEDLEVWELEKIDSKETLQEGINKLKSYSSEQSKKGEKSNVPKSKGKTK